MCMYTYNWYFCERSRQGNATRKLDLCLFSGDRMGWSTFFLICAVLVKWWENKEYSIAFGYFYNIHIRIDFLFFFFPEFVFLFFSCDLKALLQERQKISYLITKAVYMQAFWTYVFKLLAEREYFINFMHFFMSLFKNIYCKQANIMPCQNSMYFITFSIPYEVLSGTHIIILNFWWLPIGNSYLTVEEPI